MDRLFETLRFLCVIAAAGVGMPACRAADDAANEADRQAIRAVAAEYTTAVRRGDAATLRKIWTAEGDYIDADGQSFKAQDLVNQVPSVSEAAAQTGEERPVDTTLRFIAPGVAIEDGAAGYAVSEDGRELVGRFTAVWVKRDGAWRLDGLREATASSSPGHPQLKALEWLVGEWASAANGAAVLASWHWADSGNFLVGEFLTYGRDGEPVGGTQRIGWDPVAGQARMWTFSSRGGASQGHWRRDGDRWLVESTHVTGDGKQANTTAIYTPGEAGSFTVEVTGEWDRRAQIAEVDALPPLRFEFRRAAGDQ